MPKLKQTFIRGKMNKDLDERLVPKGEYRDGQNIQVSTSEGNDVGAIENVLGNTKQNNKPGSGTWTTKFGLTSPKCIGVVRDPSNEKIYWFVTSASVDAILEYDQTTDIVTPVLVDANNVLSFSANNLITGVNILEDMLFFTDDLSEPKSINISTFKAGSVQSGNTLATHTQVYGRNFIETDVTVMTTAPLTALTVTAVPSLIGGFGTGITPISTNATNFYGEEVGDGQVVSWSNQNITWSGATDPRVVLTASVTQEDGVVDQYQVTGVFGSGSGLSPGGGTLTIESISRDVPNSSLVWSMLLVESEPIFKNDFPRFSYRYKYNDGKYSAYAPFSLPAFVPGKFEYLSRDGNNEGMKDVMRKITLSNFPALTSNAFPKNAVEIEVLYKGSRSNNIYLIESFGFDFSASPQPVITLDITSGVLGRVIESDQLLRLFDNVPQKAKSQEIIGNRLVYGNYVQNYDVPNSSIVLETTQINSNHTNIGFGIPTVKTDREYQLGVSFLDSFGRESPVFTSNGGAISFDQQNSKKINTLKGKLSSASTVPSWATYFKFYIKNNTPEYYNIALDRYYSAQDGSVWLSFPSSERNKLQQGQYIRLKKQHDTSIPVTTNNRYKVIGIENEAPDYLTAVSTVTAANEVLAITNGIKAGNNKVKFYGPNQSVVLEGNGHGVGGGNESFYNGFTQGASLQFSNSAGTGKSSVYEIIEGGPTGVVVENNNVIYSEYEALLTEGIKVADTWLTLLTNYNALRAAIIEKTQRPLPEFQGRFFAKINPNATFTENVSTAFSNLVPDYVVDDEKSVTQAAPSSAPDPAQLYWTDVYSGIGSGGVQNGQTTFNILVVGPSSGYDTDAAKIYFDSLQPGSQIKFKQSNGNISPNFYTINSVSIIGPTSRSGAGGSGSSHRKFITLDRAYDDTLGTVYPATLQTYRERIAPNQELLSSSNPAVFETEPEELADIDIFYEASGAIAKSNATSLQTLSWFNAYSFGNGVESDRIHDDFNAPTLGKGVRVSSILEEPYRQERRTAGLIYSGIFNSTSGVNNLNQFIAGLKITKDLNPSYGSIQKLHARDTDLITLLEDKCFRILANKDALFNADGNVNVTSNNNVLGQTMPFVGEYGISKNPESFASFGFRSYFTDKARGAVMRLSRDGITVISDKSMSYYFNQQLKAATQPLIGSYDEDTGTYNVRLNNKQLSFLETVDGWTTRLTYAPEGAISLNTEYYTFKDGEMWEHSNTTTRANFYGTQGNTTVTTIINDGPSSIKNFKTLSYEGDEGWTAAISTKDQNGVVNTWKEREGIYFNFIEGNNTTLDTKSFSTQGISTVSSTITGNPLVIDFTKEINVSVQVGDTLYYHRSNVSTPIGLIQSLTSTRITAANSGSKALQNNDFLFVSKPTNISTSGLTGYYSTIVMTNTSAEKRELFAVNTEAFISSE